MPWEGVFFHSLFFFLSPWSPGPLVPWSSGPVVLWSRGPLVPWSLGLLGPLVRCSPLVPWSSQVYKVTSIPCEAANLDVRYYWKRSPRGRSRQKRSAVLRLILGNSRAESRKQLARISEKGKLDTTNPELRMKNNVQQRHFVVCVLQCQRLLAHESR